MCAGLGALAPSGSRAAPWPCLSVTPDPERLAEALLFAHPGPVTAAMLAAALPEGADPLQVLEAVRARYRGRGVELVEADGGWMFRTAADLAPLLVRVVERRRRLPRAAMEVLAVVAYHQPVTRAEIEERRGASLGQATLDALLEAGLIRTAGRREAPGRPTLWATTPAFLAQFGLRDLRDLPRREDLVVEPPGPELADASGAPGGEEVP